MNLRYLHVALELWGSIFCLIAMICIYAEKGYNNKENKLIMSMQGANALLLFWDSLAWIYRGNVGTLGFYMVRISNFMVYTMGYVLMVIVISYVYICVIDTSNNIYKLLTRVAYSICVIGWMFLILSQFTGTIYAFDAYNRYYRGNLFWTSQIVGIVVMAISLVMVVNNRKRLTKLKFISIISYSILPIIALIVQIFVYGIALLNLAVTASMLLMFTETLVEHSKQVARREDDVRMKLLMSQIQPHFLYNTLSTIGVLCRKEPELAAEATDSFAKYFRMNLDSIARNTPIPFPQELEHVKTYLWLEHMRFGEDLVVEYEIEVQNFSLPALTIQILVENSVTHGMMGKDGICTITIRTYEKKRCYKIQVIDDGAGFDMSKTLNDGRSHMGLKLLRERLKLTPGADFTIESKPGKGTIATVTIPKNN